MAKKLSNQDDEIIFDNILEILRKANPENGSETVTKIEKLMIEINCKKLDKKIRIQQNADFNYETES